jgi:putative ABC transport system permease protein
LSALQGRGLHLRRPRPDGRARHRGGMSRTGIAIAALMIAISAIGVGIMISSFRAAVVDWLNATLRADIYVSPPSLIGSRPHAT